MPQKSPSADPGFQVLHGIGVGCILFLVDPEIQALDDSYFEVLESELGSIENLTGLTITGQDSQFGDVIAIEIDGKVTAFPHVYGLNIKFDLHIPFKVQERIGAVCAVEQFCIQIYSNYHMPVMYITQDPDLDSAPSTSVVLVRKYLEEKIKGGKIIFECIGPSPFHADFICVGGKFEPGLTDVSEGDAYKTYLFKTEAGFADAMAFQRQFGDTLSLFYELHERRARCLDYEGEALGNIRKLILVEQETGWRNALTKTWRSKSLIDEINHDAFLDQLIRANMSSSLKEALDSDRTSAYESLAFHFRELGRFSSDNPYSSVTDIVRTYEARRQSTLQNFAILIAGLAGGVLGAILGSALTYSLAGLQ